MPRLHGHEWRVPLKSPYRKVHALMIDWEKSKEDDASERAEFQSQREALAREFKMYRFTTVNYSIPSERSRRPYRELNKRLQEFLVHDEKGTLLIIYYGGHGENNDDKNHIWLCHNPSHKYEDDNPKINWSSLQGLFLDECQSDVLFVLDCCYSAAAAEYTHATSTVEAMVATGFEGVAPLRGEHSFTMFLVSVMKSRREEDKATFADALCRMVAAKLNRTDLKGALETTRSTPRHIPFANKVDKIILGEVQEFDESDPAQESVHYPVTQMETVGMLRQCSIMTDTPGEAGSHDAGFERSTSVPVEPANHTLQVPSRPRAESTEPATRGRARVAAEASDHTPQLAKAISKSTSTFWVREDPNTRPVAITPESQSEVAEAGGGKDWLDDLYPSAPDYSAFEERLVLSKDVPCPEQYSHIRTGEIRTLHILSSKDVKEPIIARLQHQDFLPHSEGSHHESYMALSWTWGREAWTSNIYIVDENLHARHAIPVPPTLESALRHVRHPTMKVVLWVDLICIRQDATEEREFMISILPDIFKHASSAIVWLGDEDESSRSVVNFVGKVRDLENFDALVKNDDTPRQWDFLVAFLRRPWFSRRWVFQEIILAREAIIYCGSQRIGWTDFSDVVVLLGTCFDEVQYRLKRKEITNNLRHTFGNLVDLRALEAYSLIETARDLFRRQDDGTLISACDLETLVSFLPALQSNIPKDVIYSLVGLSSDSRSFVGIDYNKSNNVVYQDFVEYCVRKSKTLDIICRPWAPTLPPREAPTPSWVCQVNKLPFGHRRKNIYGRKSGDVLVGYPHRNYYSAARGSVATPMFGAPAPDGRIHMDGSMVASGFQIAPVRDLGFRAAAGTVHMEWIELSGWRRDAAFVPDHLWRTLVADRGPGGTPTPTWYHRACQYWLDYSEGQDITYDVIQKDQHPATALEYIQRVQSVIWDRTFIKTARLDELDRPLYGLGPREARSGDCICILHGCSVPVVLRRTDGSDEWQLVGECFVYGLMDGEAMDIKAFTDRTQEFLLR